MKFNINLYYYYKFNFIILKVGLMRNGQIIEEGSPQYILLKYDTDTLEAAFLTLCCNQENNKVFFLYFEVFYYFIIH